MNRLITILAATALTALPATAMAQLEPYADYTVSDSVSTVTTVKVNANMIDRYLEGVRRTWVASNEASKRLGHIQDYAIYVSDLPNSGDFNLLLVVTFANTADLAPNRERYQAFMREWGQRNREMTEEVTTTVYPNLREITGEYLMRQLTINPQ